LDATFVAPVYSAGFDFVEPNCSPQSTPCFNGDIGTNVILNLDSEFEVTLKLGGVVVDSFTFNAPDDIAAFVGVTSDEPFDKMEIRETTGNADNEYFGEFYSSDEPPVTEVSIDIKPGSNPSSVSCKNLKGTVPVAIFTTDSFDAADIDLDSLMLEGTLVTEKHNSVHLEDIDDDGDADAVLHLDKDGVCEATLGLDKKVTEFVTLSGSTSSEEFEGIGDIRIVN